MDVPNVKRKDYQLIGMEDDFLSLMDDSGDTRDDLKCPEGEIGDEIRAAISEEKEILVSYILIYSYMVADPDLN
jgi:translation initiation factor 5A